MTAPTTPPGDPVQRLLEQLLDAGGSVEEVCADRPDLLEEVRRRWRELRAVQEQVDELFPSHVPDGVDLTAGPGTAWPQIPGYSIEAELGRGGMGIVYRARQESLLRTVALKTLLTGPFSSQRELLRFQREAEYVGQLRHPHIVAVYDYGTVAGQPFYTMEWIDGSSLADRQRHQPLARRDAVQLMATLARAIEFAHRSGIVHRDLKPSNILLTADGTPKVGDFGLALRVGTAGVTATGALVGTPSYMAPEQVAGQSAAIGPATDVYGLGSILYELLTGQPAFPIESYSASSQPQLAGEPKRPRAHDRTIPRDLETICLRCLHRQPHRRYGSALALAEDLERFLRGAPIEARPTGAIVRLWMWGRRRPALAITLVCSAVLAITLLGLGLQLARDHAATREAVTEELATVAAAGRNAEWPQARAALGRAQARLGDGGPADLHERLAQAQADLGLVDELERLRSLCQLVLENGRLVRMSTQAVDADHARLLAPFGFDDPQQDESAVAARIVASNIRPALLAALDNWACHVDAARRQRLLAIARRADPDPTGFRDQVRDGDTWDRADVLATLAAAADVDTQPVSVLVTLADRLQSMGGDAMPLLERLLERHADDVWANLALGLMHSEASPEEAARYFQSSVALRPEIPASHEYLGLTLAARGRLREAEVHLRHAVELDPSQARAHLNLGTCLLRLHRLAEAAAEHEAGLAISPHSIPHRIGLVAVLTEQGQMETALERMAAAEVTDPDNVEVQACMGWLEYRTGRYAPAIERLERVVEQCPTRTDFRHNLSLALDRVGRIEDAIDAARTVVELDPAMALGHSTLGLLLQKDGRMPEALAAHHTAVQLASAQATEHHQFGTTLAIDWQLDAAAESFATALRLEPDHEMAQGGLAQTLAVAGRFDEAVAAARRYVELAKGPRIARAEALLAASARLANLAAEGGSPVDDLRVEERLMMARHYGRLGRFETAVQWYASTFAAVPGVQDDVRGGTRFHAAVMAVRAGDPTDGDAAAARSHRQLALTWLRDDLAFRIEQWSVSAAKTQRLLRDYAGRLRSLPDLAAVRDADRLARLPADEVNDWLTYWAALADWLREVADR